ncbi:hypothetical protein EGY19_10075 [Burkholderia multivorans]|uniref:hypothetical protein n=1 Tax=Burkholderia multivorans TaxID=87883 RepID=UPI000F4F8A95|nr:hypothetical protein [Burkholderia multivorans]AYY97753.1 hypothetical protein EGY19_10075 [Burkholderia multivorans]MBU9120038.1 hypothetical protein [Burkholderia multivorans]
MNSIDNARCLSPAAKRAAAKQLLKLRAVHGDDPCSREQTAAHEAGHTIIAMAFGWRFLGAYVRPQESAWIGSTNYAHSLTGRPHNLDDTADIFFAEAVMDLGGVAAEQIAGLYHPTSSYFEIKNAAARCSALDALADVAPGSHFARALALAMTEIRANAATFEVLRAHFRRSKRLTPAEGRRMLKNVAPRLAGMQFVKRKSPQ